ncbi:hypothetical protein Tsubulata_004506 [Turnera subulata]|uniref:DUF4283 domain-containing protein n=1 Tax=Turnera subulata TaxID=218843 RepID=A0A9Q0F3F7_9ROSI|nr:hypothetical protein Tsubulata_004506 [Turnera subulata]
MDHYLTVTPWQPKFEPTTHKLTSVVAWVRVPGLSTELYQLAILKEICNRIGRFLRVDYSTQKTERGRDMLWLAVLIRLRQAWECRPLHRWSLGLQSHRVRVLVLDLRSSARKGVQIPKEQQKDGKQGQANGSRFNALKDVSELELAAVVTPNHSEPASVGLKGGAKNGGSTGVGATPTGNIGKSKTRRVASKGVFIVDSTAELLASGAPVTKRSRGQAGYTLSSEDLVKVASDGSRKNVKTKKEKDKVGGDVSQVDKWSGVLAGSIPVPVAFQATSHAKEGPISIVSSPSPNDTGGIQLVSGSMEVAFDPRGQGHGDDVVPGGATTVPLVGVAPVEIVEDVQRDQEMSNSLIQTDGGDQFRRAFRDWVVTHRPWVFILVEPQVQLRVAQGTLQHCGFDGFAVVEASGRSGEAPWFLTAVYASPTPSIRQQFWQEMSHVADFLRGLWLLIEDFNTYVDQNEKLGGAPACRTRCAYFSNWIYDCQLLDLGFHGSPFTWERRVGIHREYVAERLDHGLVNQEWRTRFPDAELWHLSRTKSDHSPLLVHLHGRHSLNNSKPFRFQAVWLLDSRFRQVVESTWRGDLCFTDATSMLQVSLMKWNREVSGNILRRKKELLARINGVGTGRAVMVSEVSESMGSKWRQEHVLLSYFHSYSAAQE